MRVGVAAKYCGCSESIFRERFLPHLTPLSFVFENASLFDRTEIDVLIDKLTQEQLANSRNKNNNKGSDKQPTQSKGVKPWLQKDSQALLSVVKRGTSTRNTVAQGFDKAVLLATGKKQKQS